MESVRQKLVELLNRIAESGGEVEFAGNSNMDEIRLVAQLIDDGYLDGSYVPNESGVPCCAMVNSITLSGRKYADQLEEEHAEKSPQGKLKKYGGYFVVYLGGVLTPVIAQAIIKYLKLN